MKLTLFTRNQTECKRAIINQPMCSYLQIVWIWSFCWTFHWNSRGSSVCLHKKNKHFCQNVSTTENLLWSVKIRSLCFSWTFLRHLIAYQTASFYSNYIPMDWSASNLVASYLLNHSDWVELSDTHKQLGKVNQVCSLSIYTGSTLQYISEHWWNPNLHHEST